jgi:hypothetical protein
MLSSHSGNTPRCAASRSLSTFASAQTDSPDARGEIGDLRKRIPVDVDDVVEEVRAQVHGASQSIPIDLAIGHERADVDRAEVAHIVRQQRLLTARVGGLIPAEVRDRIVAIGLVDEEHAGLARLPCTVHDRLEDLASVELTNDLPRARVHQVVRPARFDRLHEGVGDGHRDVEVRDLGGVVLAPDELEDIGVIHPENAHVGAAPRPALLHDFRRRVVQRHERDRAGRDSHGGPHDVVLRSEPREGETGAASGLVYERHVPERVVDPALAVGQRVVDR